MGRLDTEGKRYVGNNKIFADAFNYLIYNGEEVIKPEVLVAVDTTEIVVPYGNGARSPIQKYRDTLKIWAAMRDEGVIYVLLGAEIQGKIHYAMPVKDMLYDAINYASQVDEARRSYRKKDDGEVELGEDTVTIRLTSEEFLSGFRKDDKLIPVVTAVLYLGSTPWDGPHDIHSMLRLPDERLKQVIPNYAINLIDASKIADSDFAAKFHTGLGLALQTIKHNKDKAVEILKATDHKLIDRESAEFIKEALNIDLVFTEPNEKGEVDVCKAVEDYTLKTEVLALIRYLKKKGTPLAEIVKEVLDSYDVSEKYVEELLIAA